MMSKTLFSIIVVWLGLAGSSSILAAEGPVNTDLEAGLPGAAPLGWWQPPVTAQAGYSVQLTEVSPYRGQRCAMISRPDKSQPSSLGNLMQSFEATSYRGKTVRFKAAVRAQVKGLSNRAQLWMRVDRSNQQMGFFDNMQDRPIRSNQWKEYEIVGKVAEDAVTINIGLMLVGEGQAWLDEVKFESVADGQQIFQKPSVLDQKGLENLVAFTRLLGYVRYFHPSDQASQTDWDRLAWRGAQAVEDAKTPPELADKLEDLFRPIAPTIRVFPTGNFPKLPQALIYNQDGPPLKIMTWQHHGLGTSPNIPIYWSKRISAPAEGNNIPENFPDPAKPFQTELGAGVSCLVPLAVFSRSGQTIPGMPLGSDDFSFYPSGNDRATRLADVALAWNVLQHFYPYFDVVDTDWHEVLKTSLLKAATDTNERDFLTTLRFMIAQLHDGHGRAWHQIMEAEYVPAVVWDWIEDQLVVAYVPPENADQLKPGDAVLTINARQTAEVLAEKEKLISGATRQWRVWRALPQLAAGPKDQKVTLKVQSAQGSQRTVTLLCSVVAGSLTEPRPPKVQEIKPGIFYIDLDAISDADFSAALPSLQSAQGIVFDLRGYPKCSTTAISHLIESPVTCAQWHIPEVRLPDRKEMKFSFSNWTLFAVQPRFSGQVAYITDGRAISYAETYLGIIEHYKLAHIVGQPTAGTNGNVNQIALPGGYHFTFTGMKVLKHDGSQHHGIGVLPTVPISRTIRGVAQGQDELLEKALELVSQD